MWKWLSWLNKLKLMIWWFSHFWCQKCCLKTHHKWSPLPPFHCVSSRNIERNLKTLKYKTGVAAWWNMRTDSLIVLTLYVCPLHEYEMGINGYLCVLHAADSVSSLCALLCDDTARLSVCGMYLSACLKSDWLISAPWSTLPWSFVLELKTEPSTACLFL